MLNFESNHGHGWLKLFRSMKDWEWYHDTKTKEIFIHLLLSVNYEDKKYKGKVIKRGEFLTSIEKLGSPFGLSVQQTRTILHRLKSTGEITHKKMLNGLCVRVLGFDAYQKSTDDITDVQQTGNRRVTTTKEVKKERKKEKEREGFEMTTLHNESGDASDNVRPLNAASNFNEFLREGEPKAEPEPPYPMVSEWNKRVNTTKCLKHVISIGERRSEMISGVQKLLKLNGLSMDMYLDKVFASKFLTGQKKGPWKASFDWVFRCSSAIKIIKGNYDDNGESSYAKDVDNILESIRVFGRTNYRRAKDHFDTLSWDVIEKYGGWERLCESREADKPKIGKILRTYFEESEGNHERKVLQH